MRPPLDIEIRTKTRTKTTINSHYDNYYSDKSKKVNKNGDNPKYISSSGTPKKNATTASEGIPILKASSGYYYAKMASAHIAKKNGIQNATTLNTSY